MRSAGVDLAAEPSATGIAEIQWSTNGATVTSLSLGVDDGAIRRVAAVVDKLGIDCPLGWPEEFLQFVTAHQSGHVVCPSAVAGIDWRRRLAYRETDRAVRRHTGLNPLSVAADRIGLTAMRAAGLLAALASDGRAVDRAGTGVVVEVYPAATLKCWGLPSRGYKGASNREVLSCLVDALLAAAPWLDLGPFTPLCRASDDAFDSVVAALASRAAWLSRVTVPLDGAEKELAPREGWIAIPTCELSALVGASPSSGAEAGSESSR